MSISSPYRNVLHLVAPSLCSTAPDLNSSDEQERHPMDSSARTGYWKSSALFTNSPLESQTRTWPRFLVCFPCASVRLCVVGRVCIVAHVRVFMCVSGPSEGDRQRPRACVCMFNVVSAPPNAQVQGQLEVTNRSWCHLCFYCKVPTCSCVSVCVASGARACLSSPA